MFEACEAATLCLINLHTLIWGDRIDSTLFPVTIEQPI